MSSNFLNKFQPQFAAYFNMARQNSYITLCHLSKMGGFTETENKESRLVEMKIVTQLSKSTKPEMREYLMRQLYRHFPALQIMITCEQAKVKSKVATPNMMSMVLDNLFRVLNYERDRASHFSFTDKRTDDPKYIEAEKAVARYLNHCFTAAMRTVRTRFELQASQMEFITKERYKMVNTEEKDKKGRPMKKAEINMKFAYTFVDANGRLSDMGRVFFLCQFIEKRYATMLFDALQEKENKRSLFYLDYNESQRRIIREIFSVYRVRLPKERLDSEREDMALALDMLNELKKCPAELFEHVSPEDQAKFRIIPAEGEEEILLKRSADRFAQFALRYIDEKKLFDKIRFQINFGKYRYCLKEDKHCIDGLTRIRVLQKELNGFGRFGEVEHYRTGQDARKVWNGANLVRRYEDVTRDKAVDLPYITDCRTQYLFNRDKIGLSWPPYRDTEGNILPIVDGCYMPCIDKDNNRVTCVQPMCWMSRYELPGMVFHSILCGEDERGATEKIIQDCVARYRKFFSDIKEGTIEKIKCADRKKPQFAEYKFIEERYGIMWGDIPDKIRDYLVGRTRASFDHYAADVIDKMIAHTESMLRRIKAVVAAVGGKDNKIGKKSYVDIRPGRLAGFLSQDIVYFQPSKLEGEQCGKDKLTGLNYRVMQASIAMYDTQYGEQTFEQFKQMFIQAGIINSSNKHPFLMSVLERKPENIIEFYQYYLEARGQKLKEIKESRNYKEVYFLHSERIKWANRNTAYYQKLAARYLEQPIELPRRLFEVDIRMRLQNLCKTNEPNVEYAAEFAKERCNVTHMILLYLKHIKQDKVQSFYNFDRSYKLVELLDGEKRYKPLNAYQNRNLKNDMKIRVASLEIAETNKGRKLGKTRAATKDEKEIESRRLSKYFNEYDDNERLLRRYKVQDILLFLMAKNIILSHRVSIGDFRMNKIKPNGDKGILEVKIPFCITVTLDNGERKTIQQEAIKIKNYGDFFRFLYDERVKTLLPLIKSAELDRTLLEDELDNYDTIRPQIFDLILQFEKSITDKNPKIKQEQHGFKDLLQMIPYMNESDEKNIRLTRNAFAHNSYPNVNDMPQAVPKVAIEIKKGFDETMTQVCKLLK